MHQSEDFERRGKIISRYKDTLLYNFVMKNQEHWTNTRGDQKVRGK